MKGGLFPFSLSTAKLALTTPEFIYEDDLMSEIYCAPNFCSTNLFPQLAT